MLFFSTGAVKRANPLHLDTEMSVPTFAAKQKILFPSHLKTSKINCKLCHLPAKNNCRNDLLYTLNLHEYIV